MEERIQKIMAAAGIASRRAAEEIILEGRVRVNGAVVTELGAKADPDRDHIKVDGKLINPKQPKTYLMLNKPAGCVTTMFDPEGRPTVTSLLKGVKTRVYPVGRLDYDTEGLLLLTNDGDFAFRVTHPSHELPKTYHVKIKGVLEDRQIENLEQGVFLKDGKTAPARVRKLRKEESNSWVEITIHEGRKRQVRRMIDHTGHSVIKLKRVRIGELNLGDLPLGTYRHLTPDEVKALQDQSLGGGHAVSEKAAKPGKRPAAAGHLPDFIEGPKPGRRPRKMAVSPSADSTHHAAAPATRRQSRPQEGREVKFEKKAWRPGQREERPAGRGARPAEKRFERPSGGKEKSTWARGPRPDQGPRSRFGEGRPFGDRTALRERTDRRPEGTGVRREEKRFDKPSFGGRTASFQDRVPRKNDRSGSRAGRPFGDGSASRDRTDRRTTGERLLKDSRPAGRPAFRSASSRPSQRAARPESRAPRSEGRTGWQRDSGSRGASGEGGSRPSMRRSAPGPQGRPQGPRRTGPRPAGGFGRPKGPGSRRS